MAVYNLGPNSSASYGSSLVNSLQQLAHGKLQSVQNNNNIKNISSMGFTPQEASVYAQNPKLLEQALKQKQENQYNQGLYNLLSQLNGNGEQPQGLGSGDQQGQNQNQSSGLSALGGLSSNQGSSNSGNATGFSGNGSNPILRAQDALKVMGLQQTAKANASTQDIANKRLQQSERFHADTQENHRVEQQLKREGHDLKLDELAIKESKPYIEARDASKKTLQNIKLARKFLSSGKSKVGPFQGIASFFGLGGFTGNTETEILKSIYGNMIQDATNRFGANSNQVKFLERAYPSISNTHQGANALLDIQEYLANSENVVDSTRKSILRENGGRWTSDTADEIRERSEVELDNQTRELQSKLSKNSLYDKTENISAASLPEGAIQEFSNGKSRKVVNGKWVNQ